ncbi:MAG: hypothetical protein HON23_05785 [Rickettsiales bacterium]|jgi:phospholipase/carboxylesterase|nr:hypothetical protein [Rickettsiales bacterium]
MLSFKTYSHQKITSPKKLFIFIHGFNANGQDLLSLAPYLQDSLDDCLFLSPDAPNINHTMDNSFYWYNVGNLEPDYLAAELKTILPAFSKYIEELKELYNVSNKDIYLYGFSQGALLTLHYGLAQTEAFAGLIAHSGGFIPGAFINRNINKSEVCLIHGRDDMVIPYEFSQNAADFFNEKNIPNQLHIIDNLDHSINPLSIDLTNKFLAS